MSKSAFEKWDKKQGYPVPELARASKVGWLSALKWVCMTYNNHPVNLIYKVRAEIKKAKE
jgi:hypothetical protein